VWKNDGLGLLTFLSVMSNLVSDEDNLDVLADAGEISVLPVRDVLVGDTRRDVERHDGALALDVVAVAKSAKLFLDSGAPDVESDWSTVGVEN
jgi:hypothetical protein